MVNSKKELNNPTNSKLKDKNSNLFHQSSKKLEDSSPITYKNHLSYKKVKTKPFTSPLKLWLKSLPTYHHLLLN